MISFLHGFGVDFGVSQSTSVPPHILAPVCMGCVSLAKLSLPVQGHEKEIEGDLEAYLLESWRDDPGEAGLGSAIQGMGCLFKEIGFADGATLARKGEMLDAIFYLEQGQVDVVYPEQPDQDSLSDDDEVSSFAISNLQMATENVKFTFYAKWRG